MNINFGRENIIAEIKNNNVKKNEVDKNIKIWQKKALKLKQERVILDKKLFDMDNKKLF
jgi:hypothetical protein